MDPHNFLQKVKVLRDPPALMVAGEGVLWSGSGEFREVFGFSFPVKTGRNSLSGFMASQQYQNRADLS